MDRATVVFFPEGAYGPTNNCVGIGQVLRERGHRVVFVVEESFAGGLEAQGFEERLMRLGPSPEVEEEPGQFWKDFIRETSPVFRKPTIDQLSGFIEPTWRALCDGSRYVDDRLREIFDEVRPDAIVEDNVVCFPAIQYSGRPWARIISCNPLELKDEDIPPVFSGYPAADRTGWDEFRAEYRRVTAELHDEFSAFCDERGAGALSEAEFIHQSDWLNLYLYPEEVDYVRGTPLGPTWHRLGTCVRHSDAKAELPDHVAEGDGALVYLSLGSLGSADVDLMKRLVDVLSRAPHRFIVSKGPQASEFELADNMWGEEFIPQPVASPTGRCRHHARRQQHDDRVLPLRQADDRLAALLGPVRQRAARRGDAIRDPARNLRVRGRRAARRDRPTARRRDVACTDGGHGCALAGVARQRQRGEPDREARARRNAGRRLIPSTCR